MKRNNEIHRLDDNFRTERRSYKPLFIIITSLLIIIILGLIIFKDSFKLNSIDTFEESTELLYDKKLKTNFKKIVINSDFSNIEIEKNDDDYVGVTIYGESAKEKVYEEDETLNVNLKLSCTICHNVKSGKIILSVPDDLIDNIEFNVEYGSISIGEFNNLSVSAKVQYGNFNADAINKLSLNLKSGNIKISRLNHVTIDVDMGNVSINSVFNSADIYAELGNVIITYFDITEDSKIETNDGSVVLVNEEEIYYDAKSKNGIISLPDDNENYKDDIKVSITTVTGNITVGE